MKKRITVLSLVAIFIAASSLSAQTPQAPVKKEATKTEKRCLDAKKGEVCKNKKCDICKNKKNETSKDKKAEPVKK